MRYPACDSVRDEKDVGSVVGWSDWHNIGEDTVPAEEVGGGAASREANYFSPVRSVIKVRSNQVCVVDMQPRCRARDSQPLSRRH